MVGQEIIFAGFGGQGILSMGKLLAYAGMEENLNVSWLPSYGPEMRGGTANCSVVLEDSSIGSPIITAPDVLVVMNRPSLDKFEKTIKPNGILILDADLINRESQRDDIIVKRIPAQTLAMGLGDKQVANMILLGALVKCTSIVSMSILIQVLKEHGKEVFLDINKAAIELGASYIDKVS